MNTYRVDTTLKEDGTITLNNLPFQAGDSVEIVIVPRSAHLNKNGQHPLRGKVIHYHNPIDPVAEADWDALQ